MEPDVPETLAGFAPELEAMADQIEQGEIADKPNRLRLLAARHRQLLELE